MIREFRESDWEAVCDIFDRSKAIELKSGNIGASFVRLAEDTERTADFLKSRVYVFEDAGRLLGFAGHEGDYIGWLFVDPAAFRQGVGRALLRHCLARISGEWACLEKTDTNSGGFDVV